MCSPVPWADCCSVRDEQVTSTAEEDRVRTDGDAPLQAGGLQESELEPTTVAADDTPYTSAQSFEDLQLQEDLLKVSLSLLWWLPVCSQYAASCKCHQHLSWYTAQDRRTLSC